MLDLLNDFKSLLMERRYTCIKVSTHHNGVYYVVAVIFQSLNRFGSGYVGLGHDKFNVLVLDSLLVDLLIFVVFGNGRLSS